MNQNLQEKKTFEIPNPLQRLLNRDSFIQWLETQQYKELTIKVYVYYFDRFPFEELSQKMMNSFIFEYNNNISRAFFNSFKQYLLHNREELDVPTEYYTMFMSLVIPKIRGRRKVRIPKVLSETQVLQIEGYMETEREKIMLMLSYYCALRRGELLKITKDSFDWPAWKLNEAGLGKLKVFGKGDKEGIALVPPALMNRIRNWYNAGGYKYEQKTKTLFGIRRTRWTLFLTRASEKALGFKINPHLLRHSQATQLFKDNMDIKKIQMFLRHSDISSTAIYTHADIGDLEKEYIRLYNIDTQPEEIEEDSTA